MSYSPNLIAHQFHQKNETGKDFAVGDIHGEFDKFFSALGNIDFEPDRGDRMFAVGDLIDRGPDSERCLRLVNEPWFFSCAGNHEIMMQETIVENLNPDWWYSNGGSWAAYKDANVISEMLAIIRGLPLSMTVETEGGSVGICHANMQEEDWAAVLDPDDRITQDILWGRRRISYGDKTPVKGVDKVFLGHTPVKEPVVLGNCHYIDTGACFGGELTIVEV